MKTFHKNIFKYFFVVILFNPVLISFAQASGWLRLSQVPEPVLLTHSSMYPKAKAQWTQEMSGAYVAHFTQNNKYLKVWYQNNGKWLQNRERMKVKDVPSELRMHVYNTYTGISKMYFYQYTGINGNWIQAEIHSIENKKINIYTLDFPVMQEE